MKDVSNSSRLMAYQSGRFQGEDFSFYCPFLRVGQTVWVVGYYGGDWSAKILVEYSADSKGLIMTNQTGRSRWLCFRPIVRSVMFKRGS